ncbi:hypothetical protein C4J81_03765 [Deltaproteobacteria bacterium Smac51]|nr:hypothetical protein C4J81_03765 [Deltaproteobacteria bacterium Smac51]
MVPNPYVYNFGWVSWSSIFAGAVTAIAIWIVMSIIGLALGFKIVDPKSNEPAHGLGKTMGGWHVLSIIVSLAGGGFMSGLLASQRGVAHGFLVWAIVTIVLMLVSSHAVGMALRGIMSAVHGFGSGAAGLVGSAASAGKDAAQSAMGALSQLKDNMDIDIKPGEISDKINDNVQAVLRETDEEKLQPEYLKNQLSETKNDLKKLIRQASLDPTKAEKLLSEFLENVKGRIKDLTADIDKDTAVKTLMNNRGIPKEEAEQMVDNALKAYKQAVDQAKESLDDLEGQINEAKDHLKEMADHAREKADQMTNAAAKGASAIAAAMILAAVLSMGFGFWGAKCASKWHPSPHVIVTTTR